MKTYTIYLWPGSGYFCNQFIAKGYDVMDALENLTVELINNNEKSYFLTIEEFEEIFKDEIAQDENYQDEQYLYIDATGSQYPIYLSIENMKIQEI